MMKVKEILRMLGCSLAILVIVSGCSKTDNNKVTNNTELSTEEVTENTYNSEDYIIMPDIIGMNIDEAEQKLISEGLNVKIVVEEEFYSAYKEDGEILKQYPYAGTRVNKMKIEEVELEVNRYRLQEVDEEENILRAGIKNVYDDDWPDEWPEGMDTTIDYPEVIQKYKELIQSEYAEKSFKAGEIIDCQQLVRELGGDEEDYKLIAIQYSAYVSVTSKDSGWVNNDDVKQKANNQLEIIEVNWYKGGGLPGVELDDTYNLIIKCNEDVTIRTWFEQGTVCDYICYEIVE